MDIKSFPSLQRWILIVSILSLIIPRIFFAQTIYQIIDTGQDQCYDDSIVIDPPAPGQP